MKIFGHPVHIMLIHFPSALFPMDLACAAIGHYTGNPSFTGAAFYAMCGGVMMGWLALVFGVFDLLQVFESRPAIIKKVLLHGGINMGVIIVYTLFAYTGYKHYPGLQPDSISLLILKALTIAFMIIGNFMGGSLILKHQIAVEPYK